MLNCRAIATLEVAPPLVVAAGGASTLNKSVAVCFIWGTYSMSYKHISIPERGEKIVVNEDNSLAVPDNPIIPYIEGDGIGVDISPVMISVVDAAVSKAYDGSKKISWMEIYTGEKAAELYDGDWFPEETLDAIKTYSVAIKGPLTTPVGGGFRS